jgi:hypothetical protein
MKISPLLVALIFGLLGARSEAIQITFTGSSATSGLVNTRVVSSGGVTVTASAESLINGVGLWQSSYLGIYSGGLGVTNSGEGSGGSGTHTTDNLGSFDRVVFSFSTAVILDKVKLTAYGDTDLTTSYWTGTTWSALEHNLGGSSSRTADINSGGVASYIWRVGAHYPTTQMNDSFKIKAITFELPPPQTTTTIPDAGSSLLLLAVGVGTLFYFRKVTASA